MYSSVRGNMHAGHAQSKMHNVCITAEKNRTKCSRFKRNFIHKTHEGKVYCNWRGNSEDSEKGFFALFFTEYKSALRAIHKYQCIFMIKQFGEHPNSVILTTLDLLFARATPEKYKNKNTQK